MQRKRGRPRVWSNIYTPVGKGGTCPHCETGKLESKWGKRGPFVGCNRYSLCEYTEDASVPPFSGDVPVPVPVPAPLPEPQAVPTPATPATPAGTLESIITAIATAAAGQAVNEAKVRAIVAEIAANFTGIPQRHEVRVNDGPVVDLDDCVHEMLPKVIRKIAIGHKNIYLAGPAGSGKTTLGESLAAYLGKVWATREVPRSCPFHTISCGQGLPESALVGRMVPNLMTGSENYSVKPFIVWFVEGGVFVLDETDNMDPSTSLIINSALSNGHITLPDGRRVERSPDAVLIAAANTYGTGPDRMYIGRVQLDAAFLDRFVGAVVDIGYSRELETKLCPDKSIREAVWAIRDKVLTIPIRRIVSTRALLAVQREVRGGASIQEALREITVGWSKTDLSAVGL